MSLRVSQPSRSVSAHAGPNRSRSHPVFGARPFTSRAFTAAAAPAGAGIGRLRRIARRGYRRRCGSDGDDGFGARVPPESVRPGCAPPRWAAGCRLRAVPHVGPTSPHVPGRCRRRCLAGPAWLGDLHASQNRSTTHPSSSAPPALRLSLTPGAGSNVAGSRQSGPASMK